MFSPHAVRMQRRSCHLKRERLSRGCTRCGEDTPVLAKRSAGVDFELFVVWMLKDFCWSCAVFLRGVCGTVSEVAKSDGWRGGIWTLTVGETGRCQPQAQAQPRKAAALIVPQYSYYSFRSFVCLRHGTELGGETRTLARTAATRSAVSDLTPVCKRAILKRY